MAKFSVELDQQINSEVGEGYGTISIRVVVLTAKPVDEKGKDEPELFDSDEEPEVGDSNKSPLASYLEKKSYAKWCAVFLVNGQRHHAWENTFISRDLGFKSLRDRTMVIVDLDNLAVGAISEIMSGSRQGLYEGKVYSAIKDRIIQTLKTNPEMKRLQVDAERQAMDMRTGDASVKSKLDQLIEGHHASAHSDGPGSEAGEQVSEGGHFGPSSKGQPVVVMGQADDGEAGSLPALVATPGTSAVRLHPGQSKSVVITSLPMEAWGTLEEFRADVVSDDKNLTGEVVTAKEKATVTVSFAATDYDDEDFPVLGEMRAVARFKDYPESRVLTRPIVVTKKPEPPEPIELLDDPTFLRVRSRQPVRLVAGGPAVHVRMQWNGKPSLLRGSRPKWQFSARCLSLGTFPRIGFGYMNDGRLTFILYPPSGLLTGATLDFEVVAEGPDGRQLRAAFRGMIVEATQPEVFSGTEPRRVLADAPQTVGQRHPPYDLKYINQSDWKNPLRPCFQGGGEWTVNDAGCFLEPTPTQPLLVLVINEDMGLLKNYREMMVKRKPPLDPKNIKERTNKYISHVAFHLYQMYTEQVQQEQKKESGNGDGGPEIRTEKDMRAEINRVGTTLMKLMEIGGR